MNRLTIGLVAVVLAVGCDREANKPQQGGAAPQPAGPDAAAVAQATAALPGGFVLAAAPAGAPREVADVKASAKAGDEVVVRARVGGTEKPFTAGRAVMTVMDATVKACSDNPGDACKTPWDYCCEDADSMKKNQAVVQVVDDKGELLKAGLEGVGGLKPLSEVIVKGKVDRDEQGKTFKINATGVYVAKK